jgi:protein-L-isoaspartate(D-aspartate) O-methyltransferase
MIQRLLGRRLATRLRSAPDVDPRVAEAMIAVQRHRFLGWRLLLSAYDDRSLPTAAGMSNSQPTYIARVISAAHVQPGDRVLEIGTGSGYTAAVLARLAREVVTVERVPELALNARRRLAKAVNIRALAGDGWRSVDGTFDAIVVMAGAPSIPASYYERLREGGRLIIPVGERLPTAIRCEVWRVTRYANEFLREQLFPGEWNPLGGEDGWADDE